MGTIEKKSWYIHVWYNIKYYIIIKKAWGCSIYIDIELISSNVVKWRQKVYIGGHYCVKGDVCICIEYLLMDTFILYN